VVRQESFLTDGPGAKPQRLLSDLSRDGWCLVFLREVLARHCDHLRQARGSAGLRELKTHALAQLGDPRLSPESAARASYISVRQLHRLFAREGLSFAAWVREQRLRRCRDDLADPCLRHLAISGIAERWGYRSQAHFTRAFSARFGLTPGEFRHAGRPAPPS